MYQPPHGESTHHNVTRQHKRGTGYRYDITLDSTMASLSPARAVLLAVHVTSQSDVPALRRLVQLQRTVLRPRVVLDVLLRFLPESVAVEEYVQFVKDLVDGRIGGGGNGTGEAGDVGEGGVDVGFVEGVSEVSARLTLEGIGVPEGWHSGGISTDSGEDILTPWVYARARAIDRETGALNLTDSLVAQFLETSPSIYAWYVGTVAVLRWLVFTSPAAQSSYITPGSFSTPSSSLYIPGAFGSSSYSSASYSPGNSITFSEPAATGVSITLDEFEALPPRTAVRQLLDVAAGGEQTLLEGLAVLSDYLRYRDGADGWNHMFAWLLDHAVDDFGTVWRVVRDWEGDEEIKKAYARCAVTACYVCRSTDEETVQQLQDVVHRVAGRQGVELANVDNSDVDALVERFLAAGGSMRDADGVEGEIIEPTAAALRLLGDMVLAVRMLALLPVRMTVREVVRMRFSGSREDQAGLLRRGLGRPRNDAGYGEVRRACVWLRECGVLGRMSAEDVEGEILRDMLRGGKFGAATATYIKTRSLPLPAPVVEKAVVNAVLDFYDRSTNGNRTRGGMKNASNALAVLYPSVSTALPLRRLAALISATHALSEYSLTLTPGKPVTPVQIRLYPDPPELISRVLQANPKAYLQLDSLVKVTADLVYGVSRDDSGEVDVAGLKSRVTGMCVEAALAEDDFETAFSYVVNKLVPHHQKTRAAKKSGGSLDAARSFGADTAWQAALQAGRYRSPGMLGDEDGAGVDTHVAIERVQKRMELLSQALVICPAEAMGDVLRSWRGCEEELDELLAREAAEERVHAGKLHWTSSLPIPGGEILSKGPMSLLGVASSAGSLARTLGSTAFPLHGGAGNTTREMADEEGSGRESGEWERGENGERVRKRDVISGMVTSGLASGLGWVLGAKPANIDARR
ncbi:hypothetical protein Dda_6421 [Drechslerella dactyloides]|uniref:Sec39 domain-containing protein n=1 Tax=Drechslerella dactyloides TaxID=74499 RepID=A0AAD6ITZ5_DREDA|nr:hypothetical protein Dda_6421 [Drechslerella dactyloides]